MKRVVITGMGVISPIGNDVQTFWQNLLAGVCGIDYIREFPTDELPVKIAGLVKDFDPLAFGMDKGFARKQDRFTLYGVAAAAPKAKAPTSTPSASASTSAAASAASRRSTAKR